MMSPLYGAAACRLTWAILQLHFYCSANNKPMSWHRKSSAKQYDCQQKKKNDITALLQYETMIPCPR